MRRVAAALAAHMWPSLQLHAHAARQRGGEAGMEGEAERGGRAGRGGEVLGDEAVAVMSSDEEEEAESGGGVGCHGDDSSSEGSEASVAYQLLSDGLEGSEGGREEEAEEEQQQKQQQQAGQLEVASQRGTSGGSEGGGGRIVHVVAAEAVTGGDLDWGGVVEWKGHEAQSGDVSGTSRGPEHTAVAGDGGDIRSSCALEESQEQPAHTAATKQQRQVGEGATSAVGQLASGEPGCSSKAQEMHGDDKRQVEGALQLSEDVQARNGSPGSESKAADDMLDGFERMMSEVMSARSSLQGMPDSMRREQAAQMAERLAALLGCDSDSD